MKLFNWYLGIMTLAAASFASAAEPLPFRMELAAPIDRWDEAVPLGNGQTGGLLWGADHQIRLSLDRGDIWDNRVAPEFVDKNNNYARIRQLVQQKNEKELSGIFDDAYNRHYPTKLPGARLVVTLDTSIQAQRFELDLHRAVGIVDLGGRRIECFFSATQPVALMKIPQPAGAVKFDLRANAAVKKLGYPPAVIQRGDKAVWLVQNAAAGLQYVVYVQAQSIGDQMLLAITFTTNQDDSNALAKTRRRIDMALADGWDKLLAEHEKWWADFWAQSSVSIPHSKIQQHYNLVQYFYGSASRRGAPPMPLQGVWTADAGTLPPWHGDYHHDLNTQLTYWAYLEAGHFDQGRSFIDFMWKLKPVHEQFARRFFGLDHRMVVPGVMALDGSPMGGWCMYSLSPTMGAWVARRFYEHWRYTMDRQFLDERAYPYCAASAESLASLLQPDPTSGKLKLPLSSSPEIHNNSMQSWLTPNSNFDLALIRWNFSANEEMATALNKTDEAARWNQLLRQMDDLAVEGDCGALRVSPDESLTESHRHLSHLMAIHPLNLINMEGTDRDRRIIDASMAQIDKLGTSQWCGYSFSWMACMRARIRQGDRALQYLDDYVNSFILRNGFHCNGEQSRKGLSNFHYRPFTLEGNFAAAQAVHEMLLQSWGGRLRIFPATPVAWADASFDKLRAEGGFVVSADRQAGHTAHVTITATVDQPLCLKDPFDGGTYKADMDLQRVEDELRCVLKAGQTLTLTAL